MSGLNVSPESWSLGDRYDAALGISIDRSYDTPRTAETVPGNALESMQPVTAPEGTGWDGFWRDTLRGVIGYSIAKDAAQSGINTRGVTAAAPAVATASAPAAAARPAGADGLTRTLMVAGLAAGAVLLILKLAK